MPWLSLFYEYYALEWLKDNITKYADPIIKENREQFRALIRDGVLIWDVLSPEFKEQLIEKASVRAATIMELKVDKVTDILFEAWDPYGVGVTKDWIEKNLVAFRAALLDYCRRQ